jgi:hypothetical protein
VRRSRHRKCDTARYRKQMKKHRQNKGKRNMPRRIPSSRDFVVKVDGRQVEADYIPPRRHKREPPQVCRLCGTPFTEYDISHNLHLVTLNNVECYVHRTCPGERSEN